jgi:hypothetical protein
MPIPHDTPTLYRFSRAADAKLYGPRPLHWVGRYYIEREDCECAPADLVAKGTDSPWRPVSSWLAEMLPGPPAPATERQRARLRKLQVTVDQETLTEEEAATRIREAESALPPTPKQIARAAELSIVVPEGANRVTVRDLIDAEERRQAIRALRRRVQIDADASWEEIAKAEEAADERSQARTLATALRRRGIVTTEEMSITELEALGYSRSDLDDAIREARGIGLVVTRPELMTGEEMEALSSALSDTVQAYAATEGSLDHFVEERWIQRRPRKAAIKAALPYLLDRVRSGTWNGGIDDDLAFYRHAITLDNTGANTRPPTLESRMITGGSSTSTPAKQPSFWRRLFGL